MKHKQTRKSKKGIYLMKDLQINTIRLQSGATILNSDEMLSSFPSRTSCVAKSDRASTFTIKNEMKHYKYIY